MVSGRTSHEIYDTRYQPGKAVAANEREFTQINRALSFFKSHLKGEVFCDEAFDLTVFIR
jgi:hypothetical protein